MMKKSILLKSIAAALLVSAILLSGCGAKDVVADPDTAEILTAQTDPQTEENAVPEPVGAGRTAVTENRADGTDTEDTEDTEAPFFLHFYYSLTLARGDSFDIHKYISYIDDLDSEVDLTVDGSVDPETVGEYPLTLTLTDDAGNSSSLDMTVNIVEPDPSYVDDGSYTYTPPPAKSFDDFAAAYKKDGTMVGIDVSKWQGAIDFDRVAAAGCEFVIIRIGGYAGGVFEDPNYAVNVKNAKAAGLKVGVYWYSEENGEDAVRENAEYLYSLLGGEELDFPVFFDWEDYFNLEDYKMSLRDLNEMFLAFKEEAKAHGYNAALYNSEYYLGILWSDKVKENGVWLANYTDEVEYAGR